MLFSSVSLSQPYELKEIKPITRVIVEVETELIAMSSQRLNSLSIPYIQQAINSKFFEIGFLVSDIESKSIPRP